MTNDLNNGEVSMRCVEDSDRRLSAVLIALLVACGCGQAAPGGASVAGDASAGSTSTVVSSRAAPAAATAQPNASLYEGALELATDAGYTYSATYVLSSLGQSEKSIADDPPGFASGTITPAGRIDVQNTTPGRNAPDAGSLWIVGLYVQPSAACTLLIGPEISAFDQANNFDSLVLDAEDYCLLFLAHETPQYAARTFSLEFTSVEESVLDAGMRDILQGPEIYAVIDNVSGVSNLRGSAVCGLERRASILQGEPVVVLAATPDPPRTCLPF